jgi:hypothetical protein
MKQSYKIKNTDSTSLEKIWVQKRIDSKWFNWNDQLICNSLEATIDFLIKAKKKIKEKKYIDVVVRPVAEAADEYTLEKCSFEILGWREETEQEYKERMKYLFYSLKTNAEAHKTRDEYCKSSAFKERLEKLRRAAGLDIRSD